MTEQSKAKGARQSLAEKEILMSFFFRTRLSLEVCLSCDIFFSSKK